METIFCPWEPASYLFLSSNVPGLVHYSHSVAIIAAFLIALIVFFNNPKDIVPRLFLLFASLFSVWAFLDMILWATNSPSTVMFSWALQVLLEPLTHAVAFYLFYYHINDKIPPLLTNFVVLLVLLPLLIFLPTDINLRGLLLSSCESIESYLAMYYSYFASTIFTLLILFVAVAKIPKIKDKKNKLSSIYFTIGLVTFLAAFTSGNFISSFTDDWTLSQYGLFGMPIFASVIAYSIVKFRAFNSKLIGANVLVVLLLLLVGSLLFVVKSPVAFLVVVITLLVTSVAGFLLYFSVKKEVKQREEIEKLAVGLEKANERLKILDKQKSEFVSIASHQLRSPLTAIRGYVSLIEEGSFGVVPEKMKDALHRISESGKFMAVSIDDFLNVSRIESGNMKYEYKDINLREQAEHIVEDLRSDATKRGLMLLFKTNLSGKGIVNADFGKTQQILHNLINNALKYTRQGTVTVFVHDDPAKKLVNVEFIDTGIGMSAETLEKLFGKFARAKVASSANIMGTGLGLFVARAMARAMQGDVTAHSEGEGKGSRFVLTLPLVM